MRTVAERTAAGHQNEDTRVELKATWPTPLDAAWRLGGHANAASGDLILWIIGLDPTGKVAATKHEELANWWQQVQKAFDDAVAPEMLRDDVVKLADGDVVALLFGTERAPFVIKGVKGANAAVPFREGTRCDGIMRRQLVRMLAPLTRMPTVELLHARLAHYEDESRIVGRQGTSNILVQTLRFIARLYVAPTEGTAHFPAHRQRVAFRVGNRIFDGAPMIGSDAAPSAAASFARPGWLDVNFDVDIRMGADDWRTATSVEGELLMQVEGVPNEIVVPFALAILSFAQLSAIDPFDQSKFGTRVKELRAWTMPHINRPAITIEDPPWLRMGEREREQSR